MRLPIAFVVSCVSVLTVTAVPLHAREAAVMVPIGERQLFLDDYIVSEINNLKRTMHQPAKRGAVIRPDPDRGENCLLTHSAPSWDRRAKVFKLPVAETGSPQTTFTIRQSADGVHWSRGKKPNKGFYSILYDGSDPDPARRYKAFAPPRGVAVSPDALTWTMLDVPGVPSSDEWNFSFDEKEHLFIGTVKQGGPYGRSHGLSTSKDFEHWTKPELIFHADELDQELAKGRIERRFADPKRQHPMYNIPAHYALDVYNFAVFRYESHYIGLAMMFHHTGTVPKGWKGFEKMELPPWIREWVNKYSDYTGFFHVALTCSRDMKNWKRLGDRQPFIDVSLLGTDAYDLQTISSPSNAVVRGDELWFYYNGGKSYGVAAAAPGDRYAICLAVLRRDGFISLDASEQAGSIITKPMRVPNGAKHLFVNVDAAAGELHVLIRDTSGRSLPGFSVDECVPVTDDRPRVKVTWKGKQDVSALAGKEVQIRFRPRNAAFYSFWFE